MRTWLALILTPSLALGLQSLMYALVTPLCATQTRVWLHASAAGALVVAVLLTVLAAADWMAASATLEAGPDSIHGDPKSTRRFLSAAATGVAAISCLVIVCMWAAAWVLSPCSEQ